MDTQKFAEWLAGMSTPEKIRALADLLEQEEPMSRNKDQTRSKYAAAALGDMAAKRCRFIHLLRSGDC